MKIVNLTPHEVRLNNGKVYPSEGVARVSNEFKEVMEGLYTVSYGEVEGLPEPRPDTAYIVSAMVQQACKMRTDLLAPASGHPDTVRDEKGRIVSVPGLVCNGGENEPFVCFDQDGKVELWIDFECREFEKVSDLVRHLRENDIDVKSSSCMFTYDGQSR